MEGKVHCPKEGIAPISKDEHAPCKFVVTSFWLDLIVETSVWTTFIWVKSSSRSIVCVKYSSTTFILVFRWTS